MVCFWLQSFLALAETKVKKTTSKTTVISFLNVLLTCRLRLVAVVGGFRIGLAIVLT